MIGEVLDDLTGALDRLADVDPSALADGSTIELLHRQLARLDAVTTRATAAFDATEAWADDGARTAAAWLTSRVHLAPLPAKRRVRVGRQLRGLPHTEAAWLRGDIGEAQAAVVGRALTSDTADAMARDEEQLVRHATSMRYGDFARVVDYWIQHADPDGADRAASKLHDARSAFLSTTFDGVKQLDATFDPIGGAIFEQEVDRLEQRLFKADWKEAQRRLGREPAMVELARTHAQRRCDALVEMATRSAAMPRGSRRPSPLFTVLVGWETLQGRICELASGTVVAPASLVPHLTSADFERVVFESPSRVIDVGVRRRAFEGATRRAVEVRDRECFDEMCDERSNLEIDHIIPYSAGGLTIESNGRAACPTHNRARHQRRRRKR